jgi:hypothetical protein
VTAIAGLAALGLEGMTYAATTPTVSEFVNAANCEYLINAVPAGMHRFTNDGEPVTIADVADGVVAAVFVSAENQVIIAYQGTTGGQNLLLDPVAAATQFITDIGIFLDDSSKGRTPVAYRTALNFAQFVLNLAQAQGFSRSNVFVTGHSLGGIEAEYVAQQTGLGGISLEATGLATSAATAATGTNFVNLVTDGDPVGNFSSDIPAEQPFAPAFVARGGEAPHYGPIVLLGDAAAQATLARTVSNIGNPFDDPSILLNLADLLLQFHLIGVQAHDAAVTLNPFSALEDDTGNQNGPMFNIAALDIPGLIEQATAAGKLIQP